MMKGVILGICPEAPIVDISHEINPQDVSAASFILANSVDFFPQGTIHLAVVDPGVGSDRRVLCVSSNGHFFVAPDNGILKYILARQEHVVINVSNSEYFLPRVSYTFHGRDIFAPVAAHLAAGVDFRKLGEEIHDFDPGELPQLEQYGNEIKGEIVYVDRFGNLISNIPADKLHENIRTRIRGSGITGLSTCYSDGHAGELIALIGSSGFLEVALNFGNASERLKCSEGEKIAVVI